MFASLSSKEWFLLQIWVDSRVLAWGVGPLVLCHSFIERLFCLPSALICAVLAALNGKNHITLLTPGCFVLRMDKFLPQCVDRFEANGDMMFIKAWLSQMYVYIRNEDVVMSSRLLLSVCSGSFSGFDKCPVWVATIWSAPLMGFCSFSFPSFPVGEASAQQFRVLMPPQACAPVGDESRTASTDRSV